MKQRTYWEACKQAMRGPLDPIRYMRRELFEFFEAFAVLSASIIALLILIFLALFFPLTALLMIGLDRARRRKRRRKAAAVAKQVEENNPWGDQP